MIADGKPFVLTRPPQTDNLAELAAWRAERTAAGRPLHLTAAELEELEREETIALDTRLEREIQSECIRQYRAHGCQVYITSVKQKAAKKAKVTPGVSDLILFHHRANAHWFHETKSSTGKLEPSQRNFRDDCLASGATYILGGVAEALRHLERIGVITP